MGAARGTPAERFWRFVTQTDGCWEWSGCRQSHGYGQIGVERRIVYAHRLSWELHYGPIPAGLHVCHKCDNPPCVRPDHLFLGTRSDNLSDAAHKGRLADRYTPFGEQHAHAVVSDDIVRLIRSAYQKRRGTISASDLGFVFHLSESQVFNVIHRRHWRHVE